MSPDEYFFVCENRKCRLAFKHADEAVDQDKHPDGDLHGDRYYIADGSVIGVLPSGQLREMP